MVGSLQLHRCDTPAPWCGTLVRPLDPTGSVPGDIGIYFEFYPHTAAGPATGALVATEGGPGFPATQTREEYLALFGELRATHDVVIMDNRGTGRSGAVDCQALQRGPGLTEALIGECGEFLGARAPLYSTVLVADDLAALLQALGIARVGLYGDSYGTYTAQVFARRHPQQLRALILDGAYPLDGLDYPWYPHYAPAMRDKFNIACARSPACSALPGDSIAHIEPALQALRAQPLAATVRYGAGREARFTADATQLATVMFGSAPAYASLRETDAAARAYVAGDTLPLLRLMAETRDGVDSREPDPSPQAYSAGAAAAVSCLDPRQIFDMRLAPAERLAERDRLIAERERTQPASYAPFTIAEYRGMPLDYAFIDSCVRWPAAPQAPLVSADPPYPGVPVLVISGELDNMTPPADGAEAAAHFPHAHHVVIANGLHVNALLHSRDGCAATLARHFLRTLAPGDERCAGAVPPVRLVPRFARQASELPAARAAAGNAADAPALAVVTAALLTCEDAIARVRWQGAGAGSGLRGGTFRAEAAGQGYQVELSQVRWTEDVAVSGRIDWPGRSGVVRAHVTLATPQGPGTLELTWPEGRGEPVAQARGTLAGVRLAASAPAP